MTSQAADTVRIPKTHGMAVCISSRMLKMTPDQLAPEVLAVVNHPGYLDHCETFESFTGWFRAVPNGPFNYAGEVQRKPLAHTLAGYCQRICNLKRSLAPHADAMQEAVIDEAVRLTREHLPSGSGFDNGTHLLLPDDLKVKSGRAVDKLVFNTSYHHMNDQGMYTCWTNHSVIVQPDWSGLLIQITGRDTNGIKEYMQDVFHSALNKIVEVEV